MESSRNGESVISLKQVTKKFKLYRSQKHRIVELLHPVRKKYHREHWALKGIDLNVRRGEILGIVGRNGSGKSTLLKLISGILEPTSGSVEVKGKVTALLELETGMNPDFTGVENIHFLGTIMGRSRREIDETVEEISDFTELGDYMNQPIRTYSSGMKARLGFAISTAVNPEILILDEVLSVGDSLFRRKAFARMEALLKGDTTVLFVSHSEKSIIDICNRAIFINQGEVVLEGEAKYVMDRYQKYSFAVDKERVLQEIKGDLPSPAEIPPAEIASEDGYQPDYVSRSRVEYKNYDVEIYDFGIFTTEGEPVNHLKTGGRYTFSYRVKFNVPARFPVFGVKIKNTNGFDIHGTNSSLLEMQPIEDVQAGEIYKISWNFNCELQPGEYFTNAGVEGVVEGERTFLNRIVDAFAFRVLGVQGRESGVARIVHSCSIDRD